MAARYIARGAAVRAWPRPKDPIPGVRVVGVAATAGIGDFTFAGTVRPRRPKQYFYGRPFVKMWPKGPYFQSALVTITLPWGLGTGQVGTLTPSISSINVALTGAAGTGSAGTIQVPDNTRRLIRHRYESRHVTASWTRVRGQVGTAVSGVSGTGSAGTLTASTTSLALVALSGVAGTASVGTLATSRSAFPVPLGVAGTGVAGSLTVTLASVAVLRSAAGGGAAGTIAVSIGPLVALDGVESVGEVGDFSLENTGVLEAIADVEGAGFAGVVSVDIVNGPPIDTWTDLNPVGGIWTPVSPNSGTWTPIG